MENLIRYQVLGDDSTRFLLKLDSPRKDTKPRSRPSEEEDSEEPKEVCSESLCHETAWMNLKNIMLSE